jgi:hypothetical protein
MKLTMRIVSCVVTLQLSGLMNRSCRWLIIPLSGLCELDEGVIMYHIHIA